MELNRGLYVCKFEVRMQILAMEDVKIAIIVPRIRRTVVFYVYRKTNVVGGAT